jgi:Tfp pilus assembly protein PilF
MVLIERLKTLLAQGQDTALLRFGLGNAYLQAGQPEHAAVHLRVAVQHDPVYTAAWKALGKALADSGRVQEAIVAYQEGIRAAATRGDVQAGKELRVFLQRLQKAPLAPRG